MDLAVAPGEFCGLIGANGAGKTTLFDVISGLRRPDSGTVELLGRDVTSWRPTRRARAGLRRTFQRVQTFGWLTVEENLLVAAEWRGGGGGVLADLVAAPSRARRTGERRERAEKVMDQCGLIGLRDRPAAALPIGTARLVELARALMDEPPVLLLDEPASGLDHREVKRFGDLVQRVVKDANTAVLLVEHDVGFVLERCDRVVVLHLGQVLADGSPAEVFALLPVMSGGFGAGEYIQENNVPTFGWGVNPAFCEGEVAFGITGCVTNPSLEIGSNALGTALEDMMDGSDHTVAFLGEDNDAGKGGLVLLEASVADVGFDVVYSEASVPAPPQQAGDVSPFVKDLLSAADGDGPDIIYLQTTLAGTAIADGLQTANYDGMIITPSYSPLLLGAAGYDDIYINTQLGMDPSIAANAEMMDAVHEVDEDAKMSLSLIAGWYSADMFIEGLEAAGEDLTVESFLGAMNDGFTYSVEDVSGESTWPENHTIPVPCSVLTKVEDGAFDYIQKLACGSNIEIG